MKYLTIETKIRVEITQGNVCDYCSSVKTMLFRAPNVSKDRDICKDCVLAFASYLAKPKKIIKKTQ